MNRAIETRLSKLEGQRAPTQLAHEDWLVLIDREPPMTEAEHLVADAAITSEAVAAHGSLPAAAIAARAQATRSRDPLDDLIAADLECRAQMPA